MNTRTIDIDQIKQAVDLRELAAAYTSLHRESSTEQAGPCPKCGGHDRFRAAAAWFFCRQCHPKRGDCFEFIIWLHGCTFKEAAAILTGEAIPQPIAIRRPDAKRSIAREWDAAKAAAALASYQDALWDEANVVAHEYLEQRRGLDPHTWLLYGLGYRHDAPLPNTWDAQTRAYCHPPQPAIAIPWYRKQELVAIRYRFLTAHTYTGIGEQEPRTEKQTSRGNFTGHIFGGHVIRRYNGQEPPKARTLVIVEGEVNAMSIFQIARDTGVDVLSLGSERQQLAPTVIEHAQRYRLVLLWADREVIARQLMTTVPGAFAVTSELCGGKDANDLLRAGHLGGYLSAWRFHAAKDEAARAALFHDLQKGANTLSGIDAGSRQVIEAIGHEQE